MLNLVFVNIDTFITTFLFLIGTLQLCPAEETDFTVNYATNGDFQIPYLGPNSYRFTTDPLEGWRASVVEQGTGRIYNIRWGDSQVIEMDTDKNEQYIKDFILPQSRFLLRVSYAARQGLDLSSSGLNILWNGIVILSVPVSLDYQIHTESFIVEAVQGANQLILQSAGTSDGAGMTCDDVQFYRISSYNRIEVNGQCLCQYGYFDDLMNYTCQACSSIDQVCQYCSLIEINSTNSKIFECYQCSNGYFALHGACKQCSYFMPGCNNCSSDGLTCDSCKNNQNYFIDPQFNISSIGGNITIYYYFYKLCSLQGCIACTSLIQCSICNETANYFLNSTTSLCQLCDLEGCSICQTLEVCTTCDYWNSYYLQNSTSSVCSYCDPLQNRFLNSILNSIQCILCTIQNCSLCQNLTHCKQCTQGLYLLNETTLLCQPCLIQGCLYCQSFQRCRICDGQNLYSLAKTGVCQKCISCSCRSGGLVQAQTVPKLIYQEDQCLARQNITTLVLVMGIVSYIILFTSLISFKIIGLELFGVLQLAFFNLADNQYINIYLSPLLNWKYLNGFNLQIFQNYNVPSNIKAIRYGSAFIQNLNIMLLILIIQVFIALVMHFVSSRFSVLRKICKFLLHQVFLTLFLFNSFNMAFTTGIQFKYGTHQDELFILNTFLSVLSIFIFLFNIFLLQTANQKFYGEYKQKFKQSFPNRIYISVSIIYRMSLGLYMALGNQEVYGTLIILSFSLIYIMYNLTSLPFSDCYQNYRANLCHITQLVILFVTNYYRSMKHHTELELKGRIFFPAKLQLGLIICCIVISAICLGYQIYLYIKRKFVTRKKAKIQSKEDSIQNIQHANIGMQSIQNQAQVTHY